MLFFGSALEPEARNDAPRPVAKRVGLMAASVETSPDFHAGTPHLLTKPSRTNGKASSSSGTANWGSNELRRRLPVK
jgi:hypothetical protein